MDLDTPELTEREALVWHRLAGRRRTQSAPSSEYWRSYNLVYAEHTVGAGRVLADICANYDPPGPPPPRNRCEMIMIPTNRKAGRAPIQIANVRGAGGRPREKLTPTLPVAFSGIRDGPSPSANSHRRVEATYSVSRRAVGYEFARIPRAAKRRWVSLSLGEKADNPEACARPNDALTGE